MNRPKSLLCYLCGQGFGTASLGIHQPQCYRKKLLQWEAGDPQTRGPRPVDPATRSSQSPPRKGKMSAAAMDQFNEEQFSGYKESLSPCPHCNRRFNPQSLQVHLKSCRPGNTARPVKVPGGGEAPPAEEYASDATGLIPCRKCGRSFVADRIAVHERACLSLKPRKAFNSHKQRAKGTEIDAVRHITNPKKPPSVWRQQHEEFIQALRYSKTVDRAQAAGVKLSDLPPPPPSANPDYVQCPHCARRFNPTAASRHIPSCATTVNRPKPPPGARHLSPTPMGHASPNRQSASPSGRHVSPAQPQRATASPIHPPAPASGLTPPALRGPEKTSPRPGSASRPSRPSEEGPSLPPLVAPKFCSQCGYHYPTTAAKFCSDCGSKRG